MENLRDEYQNLTIYDVKGAKVTTVFIAAFGTKVISTEKWVTGIYIIVNAFGKGLKLVIE